MSAQRFDLIQELFWDALDREPAPRARFLSELRARDADLADAVEALLEADARAEGFLSGSPGDARRALERLGGELPEIEALNSALAERYRIARELGHGGMAKVYLATDAKHDRRVALKVFKPGVRGSLSSERFRREIRLAGQLQHPNILPIFDSGMADGFLYYVMPYVEGETLAERLRLEPQLPLDVALRITREVAEALDHAHRRGIVHRDIKPANILLSDGHALVADFGIAKALITVGDQPLTETGVAVGTPAYMSPEQATGEQVDHRSDVYSLGCTLYEMLAGSPPYTGSNSQVVLRRHVADSPPPLQTARPAVPEGVSGAIEKALAKTPADRWPSAHDFVAALERADPTDAADGLGWMELIQRRSLWQVLAIYVGASWLVFEAVQTLTEGLGLPDWVAPYAFVLLLIGLPIVLATASCKRGDRSAFFVTPPRFQGTPRETSRRRRKVSDDGGQVVYSPGAKPWAVAFSPSPHSRPPSPATWRCGHWASDRWGR